MGLFRKYDLKMRDFLPVYGQLKRLKRLDDHTDYFERSDFMAADTLLGNYNMVVGNLIGVLTATCLY